MQGAGGGQAGANGASGAGTGQAGAATAKPSGAAAGSPAAAKPGASLTKLVVSYGELVPQSMPVWLAKDAGILRRTGWMWIYGSS